MLMVLKHLLCVLLFGKIITKCQLGNTPVCGTDLKTYPDICSLINARV